jgi:hypothetical protein
MLDKVEEAFESVQLPAADWNMTDKHIRRGLRRMGPWVPFGSPWEHDEKRTQVGGAYLGKWPGLLFLSRGVHDEWADGVECSDGSSMVVAFAYAYKFKKLPWYIEQKPGIPYEFGMAYREKKKLQWISMHIVVDPATGETALCRSLYKDSVTLQHGRNRGNSYMVKRWRSPAIEYAGRWSPLMEERDCIARAQFVQVFEWWQRRSERWTVSVRRAGQRVTWSVEQHLTKDFFRDRDKTALTANGQRKRIIHFVTAHSRERAGKVIQVKEHIRGIRVFTWRGYECAITAPDFHPFTIEKFDVGSVDQDDAPRDEGLVPLDRFAKRLADLEDRQAA